jgi:hypothetical protein
MRGPIACLSDKPTHKLSDILAAESVNTDRARPLRFPCQARREYRRTCETAGKSGKQIERCVISSFQIAESMGFQGDFRRWEHLLRIGD